MELDDVKAAAENDLATFIKLVSPQTVLGGVHAELCTGLTWLIRMKVNEKSGPTLKYH